MPLALDESYVCIYFFGGAVMTIRENKFPVRDIIVPQHILVSVFDKTDLDILIQGILDLNPDAHFYSTGGTGRKVAEALGARASTHYTPVEIFTGFPEMEGGLVKTLHPRVHAGLLAERNNPAHEDYLQSIGGVYIDVLVGNFYPFSEAVAKSSDPEDARINIDIGGPTMVKAAGKNWHSVAVLSSPAQYKRFLGHALVHRGSSLEKRFALAQQALHLVGDYDKLIGDHFSHLDYATQVRPGLTVAEERVA